MTREERDLLLRDLCARLPYGVKAQVLGWDEEKGEVEVPLKIYSINTDGYVYFETNNYGVNYLPVEDVRPYLRPLSTMTEEEKRELQSFFPGSFGNQWLDVEEGYIDIYECELTTRLYLYDANRLIEWLNKKMFDFRGLIPAGYAISTEVFNLYKD